MKSAKTEGCTVCPAVGQFLKQVGRRELRKGKFISESLQSSLFCVKCSLYKHYVSIPLVKNIYLYHLQVILDDWKTVFSLWAIVTVRKQNNNNNKMMAPVEPMQD